MHDLIIVYEISTEKQEIEIKCRPAKFLELNFVTAVSKQIMFKRCCCVETEWH